jgi:hypothetical protein
MARHVHKKCSHFTDIPWRSAFQKEQFENVGRPEVKVTNTEFQEMKEKHDCKKEKSSIRNFIIQNVQCNGG